MVRVSFLDTVGGFDQSFPLNYTDNWLYREIYRNGKIVMVLDSDVSHELSTANRDTLSQPLNTETCSITKEFFSVPVVLVS